jgi:O-antigen/teichoic acid export membrane protein
LFIGKCLEFAIHLLHPIVLVRVFSQTDYGLYRQLMLLFGALLPIGQLGMTQALYYFMPRAQENKHAIVLQTVIFATGAGALILCGLVLFSGTVAGLFHSREMAGYIPFVGVYSFFMIASAAIEPSLIAEGRTKVASSVLVLSQLAQSCIILTSVLIQPEIRIILYALSGFAIGRFSAQLIYFYRKYRWTLKSFDKAIFKEQIAYALPAGISNIAWFFQLKLNQFFVAFFFDAKSFAIYSVGSFKLPLISIVTSSVANVMIPELSRFQKLKRNKEILRIWYNSVRKMNLIIYPLFIFFFFFADEFIVTLFTRDYLASARIFRISLIALAVVGINTGALLNAYAQTKYLMMLGFVRLPVSILMLYWFTSMWGLVGAMSANVLLSFLFQGIILIKISRVMEIPFVKVLQWEVLAKILGASLIAVFPLVLGKSYLSIPPLAILLLAAPLFFAGYTGLSILFGTLLRQETRFFQNILRQLIGARSV